MLMYGLEIAIRPNVAAMIQAGSLTGSMQSRYAVQMGRLRDGGFVERRGSSEEWVLAFTRSGRLRALGGRDPEEWWRGEWDGVWRMLLFDIESRGTAAVRRRLLRKLHELHFGCLQRSVWLRPMPVPELASLLGELGTPSDSVALFEGQPSSSPHSAVVRAAWDFDAINAGYSQYIAFAAPGLPENVSRSKALVWAENEGQLWRDAVQRDPLLPNALLPRGYLGKRAWSHRRRLLRHAAPLGAAALEQADSR